MDRLVSTEWLAKELGTADLRIVDCTVKFEVDDAGLRIDSGRAGWEVAHIPGSSHVDLLRALSDPSTAAPMMCPPADRFAAVMESVGVDDGCRVVLYDAQMNAWAARVWWMLRAFGFERAAVLDGGWRAWSGEGRPVAEGPE
ncbi:MAG: sulfurtransferase, partial [Actinobacteria bacterium]|nr:sulfurtransferase [Actinomycetota bacterium]